MISSQKGPGEVVAEILMSRLVFPGSFLIVEGDDDSRFFRPRVLAKECQIVIGGGKPAVIGGIGKLNARSFAGALGVVDEDCDALENAPPAPANLLATDTHDLETLLLRTGALEKILAEHGEAARIAAFEVREGKSVREALLERALPFGRLRWLSRRAGGVLRFKDLSPWRFADKKAWTFDTEALLDAACAQGIAASTEKLKQELCALPATDPWRICQGHDVVDILVIGLRAVLGTARPGRDRVASTLRVAAEASELETTQLWQSIRAWQSANSPFQILPARTP